MNNISYLEFELLNLRITNKKFNFKEKYILTMSFKYLKKTFECFNELLMFNIDKEE